MKKQKYKYLLMSLGFLHAFCTLLVYIISYANSNVTTINFSDFKSVIVSAAIGLIVFVAGFFIEGPKTKKNGSNDELAIPEAEVNKNLKKELLLLIDWLCFIIFSIPLFGLGAVLNHNEFGVILMWIIPITVLWAIDMAFAISILKNIPKYDNKIKKSVILSSIYIVAVIFLLVICCYNYREVSFIFVIQMILLFPIYMVIARYFILHCRSLFLFLKIKCAENQNE